VQGVSTRRVTEVLEKMCGLSAILMELSAEWETGKRYLDMAVENDDSASEQQKIYRKKVA